VKRTLTQQHGMSLVEATIILLVLMILTSVLAPSIYDFVVDAKMVKVKEDCEAIGVSVVRLVNDVGPCLKSDSNTCSDINRINVLYSRGTADTNANWPNGDPNMEEQFTTNTPRTGTGPLYPLPMWRGAYLSAPIGPDPWGTRYGVNLQPFAAAPVTTLASSGTGDAKVLCSTPAPADANADVICLSAGPNKKYETLFTGNTFGGTTRVGDDFIFVIAGSQSAHF